MDVGDRHEAPSIAVVGSMNIDLVAYAERAPGPGETVMGRRFEMGFGGKGANQAVMARLLGARVAMVGALGDDSYAEMTLENFVARGIETGGIARVPGSSGVAPIWVEPDGTNRIIVVPGANEALSAAQASDAIRALDTIDAVVGQFEVPQAATAGGFRAARDRGAITVLNPAPAAPIDPGLLAVTDWLVPNEVEFRVLAGTDATSEEALAAFAAATATRLVVTVGSQGAALVRTDGTVLRIPATPVEAIDSTGAGDAFVGAFAYALAIGLPETDAVRLGIACASDSVTRPGTQRSFPDAARAAALLATIRAGR